jgi:hypothetical protein
MSVGRIPVSLFISYSRQRKLTHRLGRTSAVFFRSLSGLRCTTINADIGPLTTFLVDTNPIGGTQDVAIIKDGGFCSEYSKFCPDIYKGRELT